MSEVNIDVKDHGPLLVKGKIELTDSDGQSFATDKPVIALCRCGASTNQPFCTGNHRQIGFESAPRASE